MPLSSALSQLESYSLLVRQPGQHKEPIIPHCGNQCSSNKMHDTILFESICDETFTNPDQVSGPKFFSGTLFIGNKELALYGNYY